MGPSSTASEVPAWYSFGMIPSSDLGKSGRLRGWRHVAVLALTLLVAACGPQSLGPREGEVGEDPGPRGLALAGELERGAFSVGFRKETLRLAEVDAPAGSIGDSAGALPSALDLYLWYPALEPGENEEASNRFVFADYYRAQETEEPTQETLREWLRKDMTSPPGLEGSAVDSILEAPMWAQSGAKPALGRHPLVLWSYRDSIPTMQAVLNEYLASHGYVVAFAWPVDHAPSLPWQKELTWEDKGRSLETQIHLLERVLDALVDRAFVDGDRTAVLAWSYGGESANGLQRRRPEVGLALGVDTTLASGWILQTPEALATLDRSELSAPYVLLKHGRPRIDVEETPEPPLLSEVPAGAWYVRFPELSHGNFNFPGGMLPGILGLEEVSRWAVGGEKARVGYELVCRHVLGFLNLHRMGGSTEEQAWSSWSAGAPAGFVEINRYPPKEGFR